jgi:hypothetical protein
MNTKMKHGAKPKFTGYRKILENKAEEVRRSMSAQKAAQVVARLDCPSDEGDLSQQHHEEWIFLNRLEAVPWARYCVTCQEAIANRVATGEYVNEFQEAR